MKSQLSPWASTILLSALVAACATPTADPTQPVATEMATQPPSVPLMTSTPTPDITPGLHKGEITSQALANNLLGDPTTRKYYIYLPPGYDTSDKRYPVVYVLHGIFQAAETYGRQVVIAEDSLIAEGEAREMIVVFVDGSNRLGGSMYLSSPTIGDYETYITKELVSEIDAKYRTLSSRDSRGISGCSMGGDGAAHLALKYPDVFSVAAPVSGTYDWEADPSWERARTLWNITPHTWEDWDKMGFWSQNYFATAAAAAADPDKPPFYLDMPFEIIGGEAQIVPDVYERINALDPAHDLLNYLNQPVRLRGLMIYHGDRDSLASVEMARRFDKSLTEMGVPHEYVEVEGGVHCKLDWAPVLEFMSDHLIQ